MRQNENSFILGVTGGIGSGKSTVSTILKEFGAVVIDADVISREIVSPGEMALVELTEVFGKDILDDWGQLNRKLLAGKIFNDEKKLLLTNSIMHKYVAQRIKDKVIEEQAKKTKLIVIDAPIPIKTGFLDVCDKVWTVTSSMQTRINRVMKRSGMTYEEAESRIKSQISDEDYMKIADTIIYNDNDLLNLKMEVEEQFNRLLG